MLEYFTATLWTLDIWIKLKQKIKNGLKYFTLREILLRFF